MIVTSSEVATWQACKRKWGFTSHNAMGLSRKGRQPAALNVGSLVHKGLEVALDGDPLGAVTAVRAQADKQAAELEDAYVELVGCGWSPEEREAVEAETLLAEGMVGHHTLHYGSEPLAPLRALATELSFKVPIPGTPHHLAGTWDVVAPDATTGHLWLVDHKTYSSEPHLDRLELSWQFRGYIMAAQALFPTETIGGVLYNGLKKALPKQPKLLTTGKRKGMLSNAKTVLSGCAYMTYVAAIAKHQLRPFHYVEELDMLSKRPSPFFTRHRIYSNVQRQRAFQADLAQVVTDMVECQSQSSAVPTFGWNTCNGCSVRALCSATENLEPLPMNRYHRTTYATTAALVLEPSKVASLKDLESLL